MSDEGLPGKAVDDGGVRDAKPACVALVPVVTSAQWSQIPHLQLARSDSTFVTHLIATAEHVPQTRSFRRATPADAQTAYGPHPVGSTGIRTRQTI